MYLLISVINNEEILNELLTAWLDIGVTGATIVESMDSLQLISRNIPIFAGFRALTNGGNLYNKTLFAAIEDKTILDMAAKCLETLCNNTGKSSQGVYFVIPITAFKRLGQELDPEKRQEHLEKKIGKSL
ncbi:nitrogen regulatory domain-containing protein [Desulfonema limicola]|uniref:Nitrogen regulatory domain-containing protein n=1 Tax=Desulfonema limicola TaxID=45656 RepID=A0A975B9L3_9BACT|nr:hypothetical protein [Desulfonema limicola]QTA81393.1 nitrogen regulatory domain-containing protein [Desulfonema limicola]